MNWRLVLSKRATTEALTTTVRIAISLCLVAGAYMGYHLYANVTKAAALDKATRASEQKFTDLRKQLAGDQVTAAKISRAQLEVYGPTEFTDLLDRLCKRSGARIVALRAESMERVAIDNFEGAKGIDGWKVLGHDIDIVGSYGAIQGVLEGLNRFPMPFELIGIDLARVGLTQRAEGAEIELKMNVEVYQRGSQGGAS